MTTIIALLCVLKVNGARFQHELVFTPHDAKVFSRAWRKSFGTRDFNKKACSELVTQWSRAS
jgi:hypothetical protein